MAPADGGAAATPFDPSPLSRATWQMLVEIGFVGAGHGAALAALELFEALAVIEPLSIQAQAGRVTALLTLGRSEDAVRLSEAANAYQRDDRLTALYILSLKMAGREGQAHAIAARLKTSGFSQPTPSHDAEYGAADTTGAALTHRLTTVRNVMMPSIPAP
jgi:hypothetical protein